MLRIKIFIACLFVHAGYIKCAPIKPPNSLDYLRRYGYLYTDPKEGGLLDKEDVSKALKLLQRMGGLRETGELDSATVELMGKDRCGMADFSATDKAKRRRRYKKYGTQWTKTNLTWFVENSNNDNIKHAEVRDVMKNAFKKWSDITNLDFKEVKNPDIRVRFEEGQHDDIFAFDGPKGVLAHAFYPPIEPDDDLAGDVHFDDAEVFTVRSPKGRDLMWIAVHELGHSIGLDHSELKGAVMYPWYQSTDGKDFDLSPDDVNGAQSLYGIKNQTGVIFPPVTQAPVAPVFCLRKVKTGYTAKDGRMYVINGDKAYVFSPSLVPEKGPMQTSKLLEGLNTVDAVFLRPWDSRVVAFSGKQYYVFKDGIKVSFGLIHAGFIGLDVNFSDVKSAFVWPGNGKLYLFKGIQYWRFTGDQFSGLYILDPGYPRLNRNAWKGIPEDFDSVLSWRNGKTYFFKGNQYYRLNDAKVRVEYGYPLSISPNWSKCVGDLRVMDSKAAGLSGFKFANFVTLVLLVILLI